MSDTQTRVRRERPAKPPEPEKGRGLLWTGVALITAGALVLAWVAWEFWGTNWVSHRHQQTVLSQLHDGWNSGEDGVRTDFGRATAILHVPRFGEDYAQPVLEGTSDDVLAAGVGHMEDTADAGQEGNYVLAAHRVTHGEPFAQFPSLKAGDKVYVETRTKTYTYVLDNGGSDLIVPFTTDWVIQPHPVNPDGGVQPPYDQIEGAQPGGGSTTAKLITLVTCSEIFHTDNRSVVFGHLVDITPSGG
jgi:sortase A